MKRLYLAFVGDKNCSTGEPNKKSGRMSRYGIIKIFQSKIKRDQFCDQYNHKFNMYPIACNKKSAWSQFCAGQSYNDFLYYIFRTDYSDDEVE